MSCMFRLLLHDEICFGPVSYARAVVGRAAKAVRGLEVDLGVAVSRFDRAVASGSRDPVADTFRGLVPASTLCRLRHSNLLHKARLQMEQAAREAFPVGGIPYRLARMGSHNRRELLVDVLCSPDWQRAGVDLAATLARSNAREVLASTTFHPALPALLPASTFVVVDNPALVDRYLSSSGDAHVIVLLHRFPSPAPVATPELTALAHTFFPMFAPRHGSALPVDTFTKSHINMRHPHPRPRLSDLTTGLGALTAPRAVYLNDPNDLVQLVRLMSMALRHATWAHLERVGACAQSVGAHGAYTKSGTTAFNLRDLTNLVSR